LEKTLIAIHTRTGAFAVEWLAYCRENGIPYKEVDCFASNIIDQLRDCRALFWHWEHSDYCAALFARQLIASAEEMGIEVFPGTPTTWHYDDKIGQKYLLEAIGAPLIPSHVFYDRDAALKWIDGVTFPRVWKLRGGAGSQNVHLARNRNEARRIVKKSFREGWSNSRFHALKDRLWQFRRGKNLASFSNIGRGVVRAIIPHNKNRRSPIQKDYVYFQDFIPENDFDIRVVVIGKRAFAIKRVVRKGDFRASGSGVIIYDLHQIPIDCVKTSFVVACALRSQSCAFDFVKHKGSWLIIEISYAFSANAYRNCPGYWDEDLRWHARPVSPERFMIEDLLHRIETKQAGLG
jgi:glutathione synthase/RimK-type ligase-like ATP-grasp enzyme